MTAGYHDLFQDGVFWRVVWEVKCDRTQRIVLNSPTEYWIQSPGSIRLARLWVQRVPWNVLKYGLWVFRGWNSWLEANPLLWEAGGHVPPLLPRLPDDPSEHTGKSYLRVPAQFGVYLSMEELDSMARELEM